METLQEWSRSPRRFGRLCWTPIARSPTCGRASSTISVFSARPGFDGVNFLLEWACASIHSSPWTEFDPTTRIGVIVTAGRLYGNEDLGWEKDAMCNRNGWKSRRNANALSGLGLSAHFSSGECSWPGRRNSEVVFSKRIGSIDACSLPQLTGCDVTSEIGLRLFLCEVFQQLLCTGAKYYKTLRL